MVKNLSCVSYGSLKRFPHTFTTATHYNTVTIVYKIWYKGTKTCNKHIFRLFLDDSHNESLILFATFNWHTYINTYLYQTVSARGTHCLDLKLNEQNTRHFYRYIPGMLETYIYQGMH